MGRGRRYSGNRNNTTIFIKADFQLIPILSWAATSFSDWRNQNLRLHVHAWQRMGPEPCDLVDDAPEFLLTPSRRRWTLRHRRNLELCLEWFGLRLVRFFILFCFATNYVGISYKKSLIWVTKTLALMFWWYRFCKIRVLWEAVDKTKVCFKVPEVRTQSFLL